MTEDTPTSRLEACTDAIDEILNHLDFIEVMQGDNTDEGNEEKIADVRAQCDNLLSTIEDIVP